MDEWFFDYNGQPSGPIAFTVLRKFVAKGVIQPSTRIRQGAKGEWVEARTVDGLGLKPTSAVPSPPPAAAKPGSAASADDEYRLSETEPVARASTRATSMLEREMRRTSSLLVKLEGHCQGRDLAITGDETKVQFTNMGMEFEAYSISILATLAAFLGYLGLIGVVLGIAIMIEFAITGKLPFANSQFQWIDMLSIKVTLVLILPSAVGFAYYLNKRLGRLDHFRIDRSMLKSVSPASRWMTLPGTFSVVLAFHRKGLRNPGLRMTVPTEQKTELCRLLLQATGVDLQT